MKSDSCFGLDSLHLTWDCPALPMGGMAKITPELPNTNSRCIWKHTDHQSLILNYLISFINYYSQHLTNFIFSDTNK